MNRQTAALWITKCFRLTLDSLHRHAHALARFAKRQRSAPQAHSTAASAPDDELKESRLVLDAFRTIFREYSIADMKTLRGYLADATILYDVLNAKRKASNLLETFEKLAPPEIFRAMVVDLSQFLAPHLEKFIREVSGEGPYDLATLRALALLTAAKEWEASRPQLEHRMQTVRNLEAKVRGLSRQEGITDEGEIERVLYAVSRKVGDDPVLLGMVEAGDLSSIEQLFSECRQRAQSLVN